MEAIHVEPDGVNINVRSGATAPASLAEAVVARGADVGFALDGDADRLIAVDAAGRWSMAISCSASWPWSASRAARSRAAWSCPSCPTAGCRRPSRRPAAIVRTPVGDKYILEGMQVSGADWAARSPAT